MSEGNVTPFQDPVNKSERNFIDKVRRTARRYNLRLVKSRRHNPPGPGCDPSEIRQFWDGWQLHTATVLAERLTIEEALAICQKLKGRS